MAALHVAIHAQRPVEEMLAETAAAPLAFTMTVRGHVGARPLYIEAGALRACDSETARVDLIAQRAYEAHAGAAGGRVTDAPDDFDCTLCEVLRCGQWHGLVYERLPASKHFNPIAALHVSVV